MAGSTMAEQRVAVVGEEALGTMECGQTPHRPKCGGQRLPLTLKIYMYPGSRSTWELFSTAL